jgi:hypothetical protein
VEKPGLTAEKNGIWTATKRLKRFPKGIESLVEVAHAVLTGCAMRKMPLTFGMPGANSQQKSPQKSSYALMGARERMIDNGKRQP